MDWLDTHIGKTYIDSYLTLYNNSRRTEDLSGSGKIVKPFKEKIKEHFHDFGVGVNIKGINHDRKNYKLKYVKIKNVSLSKDITDRLKRQLTEREDIFSMYKYISNKCIASRIYLEIPAKQ